MKVLAVGDTHVKPWIIDKVSNVVSQYDKVVFVGDFVDNWGYGPVENIIHLRKFMILKDKYPKKIISVVGNHDLSYILNLPQSGFSSVLNLLLHTPDNSDILTMLDELPVFIEIDGITYSHAGFVAGFDKSTPKKDLWTEDSPVWARPSDGFIYEEHQVFGHTPHQTCTEIQPNVWCIDTFSQYRDGKSIGDGSVLEVIDGMEFNIVKL